MFWKNDSTAALYLLVELRKLFFTEGCIHVCRSMELAVSIWNRGGRREIVMKTSEEPKDRSDLQGKYVKIQVQNYWNRSQESNFFNLKYLRRQFTVIKKISLSSDLAVPFDVTCIVKETKENLAESNFYVDWTLVLPLSFLLSDQNESVYIQI